MKAQELRELSLEDLQAREKELREEIFHSRMKLFSGELENSSKVRYDRRDLARLKTIIAERTKAEAK